METVAGTCVPRTSCGVGGAAVSILTETGPTPTLAESRVGIGCDGQDGLPASDTVIFRQQRMRHGEVIEETTMNQDEEHLRLLSIFHYVVGGITALFACLPCIHLGLGIALVSGALPVQPGRQSIGISFGWLFIVLASVLILVGWTLAVAIVNAGRCLAGRTHYMRCFVVAGIECIIMPFGTVLGVFTIIVLSRPSVKALFQSEGTSQG